VIESPQFIQPPPVVDGTQPYDPYQPSQPPILSQQPSFIETQQPPYNPVSAPVSAGGPLYSPNPLAGSPITQQPEYQQPATPVQYQQLASIPVQQFQQPASTIPIQSFQQPQSQGGDPFEYDHAAIANAQKVNGGRG
jgi:hypothetical protein